MSFKNAITAMMVLMLMMILITEAKTEKVEVLECPEKSLPQVLTLKLSIIELKLKIDDRKVAVTEIGDRGRVVEWKGKKNELFGLYSDKETDSSFSVAASPRVTMYGSFTHNGSFFSIRPLPRHYRPLHRSLHHSPTSLLKKISICGSTHLLERHPPTKPYPSPSLSQTFSTLYNDVVVDRLGLTKGGRREQGSSNHHFIMSEHQFQLLKKTHNATTPQQLIIELYVVIDYSVYKHWLELHRTSEKAITDLRYYYAHIVNGMSKRYGAMDIPGIQLSVSVAGFYIAKTRNDAFFTENVVVTIDSTTIDVYKALDHFFEWVREKVIEESPSLPRFDAAMLFTRYILGVKNNETNEVRTISGLADIGALCQVNSVSIIKDFGVHGTMDTATHELAHNLGANHDGFGNECSSSKQYIMSLAPNKVPDYIYNNTHAFSKCSKSDFEKYIAKLNRTNRNCMLDGWESVEKANVSSMLEHYPGRNYSLDQQCRLIFGRESFFCGGGGSLIKDLCKEMFCYRPNSRSCKTDVQLKAADGTPCDNKAWCQGGHCTASDKAPEFDNSCPFGDFRDKIPILQLGHITCKHLSQKDPTLCYNEFYQELCCETCAKLHTKIEGCEYGDRNLTKCPSIQPIRCYSEGTREECCHSCELKKPKNATVDCIYGDRAEWCKNTTVFNRLNCYTPQDSHVCCETCQKFQKGPEGCEYGDRGTGCHKENCDNSNYWLYCCETCASSIDPEEFNRLFASQLSTPVPNHSLTTSSNAQKGNEAQCTKDEAAWCSTLKASQCYNAHQTCCKKCQKFYKTNKRGCEYGDKSYECDVDNCVGESYIDTCCETCSSVYSPKPITTLTTLPSTKASTTPATKPPILRAVTRTTVSHLKITSLTASKTGSEPFSSKDLSSTPTTTLNATIDIPAFVYPVECPKGDRSDWCVNVKASQCYTSQETCCHSCSRFYNPSIEGCEYGDKASWCESHVAKHARDCSRSSSSVASNCCHSCAHAKQATEEMHEHRDDRGVEWLCKAGDQASYCATLTEAYSCYSYQHICCEACTRFLDHSIPDCPFGDRVSWCARYRGDEKSCRRRDIGSQCCKTCATFVYNGKIPMSGLCKDQASWCSRIKPSQCYHKSAEKTCCSSCHQFADGNEGECRYGDKVSWCEPQFCRTNPKECCRTCAQHERGV